MQNQTTLPATPVHGIVHMPKCWTCEGTGKSFLRKCYRCNGTGVFVMKDGPTQGPWKIMCDEARGRPRCLIVDDQGNEIASVNPFRQSWENDAKAIASVPVMAEALRQITAWHDMDHEKMTYGEVQDAYDKTIDAVKAALQKVM